MAGLLKCLTSPLFALPIPQAKLTKKIQKRRQQAKKSYAKYATAMLTMMRRAGSFTQAEKVDRFYENLRGKYKLYVRLDKITDLTSLAK